MGSKNMEKRTHSKGVYLDSRGQGHHGELFSRLTAKTLTRTYGMLLTDSRTRSRQNDWKRNTEKVLAPIDLRMEPIGEPSQDFTDWVWEHGMSFSRYGIYKETSKGKAEFECTHCQKTGIVDRSRIRLRNNEKGECPFCGSRVTYKARGKMPCQIVDERWFIYVDRQEEGFFTPVLQSMETHKE